jgi:repressor of nif and glnA expression
MTLHEAIIRLLKQTGRAMSTREIADALNKNKWYEKKDRSAITDFHVPGIILSFSTGTDRWYP